VKEDTIETSAQEKGKYQSSKQPIEFFDITTPEHEIKPTFKRLKLVNLGHFTMTFDALATLCRGDCENY